MSYSTSYQSPSLDQNTKPSDRTWASVGAVIFMVLLFLLIFWRFFSKLDPAPEAEGLMASFGNVAIAGGGGAENPSTDPQPNPEKTTTSTTTEVEEVETNDNIESESVNTEEHTKSSENSSSQTSKSSSSSSSETKAYVPKFGGSGTGSGQGKQGTPEGTRELGGTGKGDKGNGTGKMGEGRECITNCLTCEVSPNDFNKISEVGTAYVKIFVDPTGKVYKAVMADAKDYPQNANIFGSQADVAIKCAMQRFYEPAKQNKNNQYTVVDIKFKRK